MNIDDTTFFTFFALWLCPPGVAWLVRKAWGRSNRWLACRKSTSIVVTVYYAIVMLLIIEVYAYNANTGGESPLLMFLWLLVFAAPIVAAYVFWEGRTAWP